MIYLFYGLEEYLINREVKKIIVDNSINELCVERFDLTNNLLEDIIECCQMSNLFSDKKIVIVSNAYIFSASNLKKNILEHNINVLEEYLTNINKDTILVFIVNSEKLDERKKIVKNIKKIGIVKEFNKENNLSNIVKEFFSGYNISLSTISKFIARVGNNLLLLESEAEKLKIYKMDDKKIEDIDVEESVNKNIDLDIFGLIDCIVIQDKKQSLQILEEMIKYGEEPIKIMILLANQFRLMYQVKCLYKKGYSEKDIASTLIIHPYRIKLALEKSKKFSENSLLNYLNELADLDHKIKQSAIDKKLALELFIMKI